MDGEYLQAMALDGNSLDLIGRHADERLLDEDLTGLPDVVGRPEAPPPSAARRRLVGIGAAMTGLTLVAGLALIALGIVDGVTSGLGAAAIGALVIGIVLLSTHWGWVHVAEVTAVGLEGRRDRELLDHRRQWLESIEPYTRWSVSSGVAEDGSITIVTTRYRPVGCGELGFTFVREIADREVHSGEEPAAAVAERAELLRRRAAADTRREREGYEAANDIYERALLAQGDEQERLAALRATSEALSERINSHLREPPLTE